MMTATLVGRQSRAERRSRLLTLIARATEELITLEAADRHATRLTPTIAPEPLSPRSEAAIIRAWAAANDYPMSTRGPIPNEVRDAYTAAHPQEPTP